MVPVPLTARNSQSTRFLYILFSISTQHVLRFIRRTFGDASPDDPLSGHPHFLLKRDEESDHNSTRFITFACLIPVLVIFSGVFAGLTLGYMSLDETQLNVLSISGTPEQRKYAKKIMPVRKNGHMLLVTLLLANMIVNESLPVIADPVLGGGIQGVAVSTVLIVIFAEIIPQSLFTRHGLYLGAKMAWFTRILIYALGIFSWPVSKLLEFVLGPHHGIIYRRAELKELIAMHSSQATHGGDLKTDTVTIIGATLDLQEKVVKQAMTPIEDVFMLSIDSKLDYDLLKKICQTGHSRVPVYEEVEVPMRTVLGPEDTAYYEKNGQRTVRVKKIIGILLVKHCVLLDPKDATPLRKIPLNKVPFVPNNEPLLGILDKFQEGGSHMAIVSRFSAESAASMKKAVKRGLTQRLRARVRLGDTDSDTDSSEEENTFNAKQKKRKHGKFMNALRLKESNEEIDTEAVADKTADDVSIEEEKSGKKSVVPDIVVQDEQKAENEAGPKKEEEKKSKTRSFQLPKLAAGMTSMSMLEQSMPADAVLTKEGAAEFLQGWDPAVMPLGIITLEDVLEELIGEEIYDEFDNQGAHGESYGVPPIHIQETKEEKTPAASSIIPSTRPESREGSQGKIAGLKTLGFFRTRSAPPVSRVKLETSSNKEGTSGEDDAIANGSEAEGEYDASPTILMPRPIPGSFGFGRNPPSIILEQNSSISSSDTGVSGTLVSGDISITGQQPVAAGTPSTANPTPETSQLMTASSRSVMMQPVTPPPKVTTPVPTLEAVLLDRKRRLAAHAAASGSGISSPANSSSAPGSYPPILYKDFAFRSTSPTPSVSLSVPTSRSLSPAVGSIGKGTKFKSSPLGGGNRTGDVVAERVGAAYSSASLVHQSEEDRQEVEDDEKAS